MSSLNSDISAEKCKERGYTPEETKTLLKWIEEGKPGLAKFRAENFGSIYALGYSCQDIHKWFPEYPVPVLLWARFYHDWDQIRSDYRASVNREVTEVALSVKLDAIKFISESVTATHAKWRRDIMDYLANPKAAKEPDFLPKTLHAYGQLLALLEGLTASGAKGSQKGLTDHPSGSSVPLMSVVINQPPATLSPSSLPKQVVEISSPADSVKAALLADIQSAKKK